ncbi:DP-EP family protein [Shewanella algae]|uniref:DP-EP family protein n=1 Tax=Shewanella algae TaxID=38313 RepID=UPI0031F4ACBC
MSVPVKNIIVTITLDDNRVPQFAYEPDGPVVVDKPNTHIIYKLQDKTGMDLAFVGASFDTPFDGIIDAVKTEAPDMLILMDTNSVVGNTGFRLILSNSSNTLLVSSQDPEVINRPKLL